MLKPSHMFSAWLALSIMVFALEFREYGFIEYAVLESVALSAGFGLGFIFLDWVSDID